MLAWAEKPGRRPEYQRGWSRAAGHFRFTKPATLTPHTGGWAHGELWCGLHISASLSGVVSSRRSLIDAGPISSIGWSPRIIPAVFADPTFTMDHVRESCFPLRWGVNLPGLRPAVVLWRVLISGHARFRLWFDGCKTPLPLKLTFFCWKPPWLSILPQTTGKTLVHAINRDDGVDCSYPPREECAT